MSGLVWLVPLLCCPRCGAGLVLTPSGPDPEQGILGHAGPGCDERYPVIDGIPRLLLGDARSAVVRRRADWFASDGSRGALGRGWSGAGGIEDVVADFDYEWSRYSAGRTPDLDRVFDMYFDLMTPRHFAERVTVLDGGCGAGRWALAVADRGPRVIAVDLGFSVEIAKRNAGGSDRLGFVQADLAALPLRDGAVDWAYSLGVLHHIVDPAGALAQITAAVRSAGDVLLYLYYALDGRSPVYRALFAAVDGVRRVTSVLPRPLAHAFAIAVAVLVYWPLARLSRLLAAVGLVGPARALPLSFYRDLPFSIMRNDSLDRLGTRLEQRFTKPAMRVLMERAGLTGIRFSSRAPYWHALGTRAS